MSLLSQLKKLLKINYAAQLQSDVEHSLFDARRRYVLYTEQKLYTDAMVTYQLNRIKFLAQVADKLKGSQDDKSNCITSINAYSHYYSDPKQGN